MVKTFTYLIFILGIAACGKLSQQDKLIQSDGQSSINRSLNKDHIIALHPGSEIQSEKAIKDFFNARGFKTTALRNTFRSGFNKVWVVECQNSGHNFKSDLGMTSIIVSCVLKDKHTGQLVYEGTGKYGSFLKGVNNIHKATLASLERFGLAYETGAILDTKKQDREEILTADTSREVKKSVPNLVQTGTLEEKPKHEVRATVQEKRSALIIGNADYLHLPALRNPLHDAKDFAEMLENMGFSVSLLLNASQENIEDQVRLFGKELTKKGGVGLFYYAGHGVQINGSNFLIPADAKIVVQKDVKYKAVNMGIIMDEMGESRDGLNIIILDACRDNPLPIASRSMRRGLAQVTGPKGSFIAFATAPGNTANDGSGRNGTFTKYLLKHLGEKGSSLESVFKSVRKEVFKETNGAQMPWINSSFMGDFYFVL